MAEGKHSEGWIAFAIVTAMIAGCANGIFGLVALVTKEVLPENGHAFLTLQQWGWALIILGVVQFVAAFMIAGRKRSGRILGIVLAALSLLSWVTWAGAFPVAGLTAIVLDILIIFGLSVTGEYFE